MDDTGARTPAPRFGSWGARAMLTVWALAWCHPRLAAQATLNRFSPAIAVSEAGDRVAVAWCELDGVGQRLGALCLDGTAGAPLTEQVLLATDARKRTPVAPALSIPDGSSLVAVYVTSRGALYAQRFACADFAPLWPRPRRIDKGMASHDLGPARLRPWPAREVLLAGWTAVETDGSGMDAAVVAVGLRTGAARRLFRGPQGTDERAPLCVPLGDGSLDVVFSLWDDHWLLAVAPFTSRLRVRSTWVGMVPWADGGAPLAQAVGTPVGERLFVLFGGNARLLDPVTFAFAGPAVSSLWVSGEMAMSSVGSCIGDQGILYALDGTELGRLATPNPLPKAFDRQECLYTLEEDGEDLFLAKYLPDLGLAYRVPVAVGPSPLAAKAGVPGEGPIGEAVGP